MIEPKPAAVRPRVVSPLSGENVLLEEEVRQFYETGRTGILELVGHRGSGRTTALRHLAAVFSPARGLKILDREGRSRAEEYAADHLVVCAGPVKQGVPLLASYELARWDADDRLEYLWTAHRGHCGSVMARLAAANLRVDPFLGVPNTWRPILDQMALDSEATTPQVALRRYLNRCLRKEVRELVNRWAAASALDLPTSVRSVKQLWTETQIDHPMRCLLLHRPVSLLLAADQIAAAFRERKTSIYLCGHFPVDLLQEVASRLKEDEATLASLQALLKHSPEYQPNLASLLHATDTGWLPSAETITSLKGAYLVRAAWPDLSLPGVLLERAKLRGADLRRVTFDDARAQKADLCGVCLQRASLQKIEASGADLTAADLSFVQAAGATFDQALLTEAILEGANLQGASLLSANLERAKASGACFESAILHGVCARDADFTEANFCRALLTGADLTGADLRGACFTRARMGGCNLEDIELPDADFSRADLRRALLTGSRMPDARFDRADLRDTGLAEIDWERASLRGADLTGASFHLGTSRSGLVGSVIAGEGSRTGFYTDDYNEQDFKSPEEIRKANLRNADLRKAKLKDVDFYLVDLRGAMLDPDQEAHMRRCGAILEARV